MPGGKEELRKAAEDSVTADAVCRYCGQGMVLYERENHHFVCPHCGSCSPVSATREGAIAAAARVQDMKPMTLSRLKKARGSVYLEIRAPVGMSIPTERLASIEGDEARLSCVVNEGLETVLPLAGYGKSWRCWAVKPTKQERRKARWRTNEETEERSAGTVCAGQVQSLQGNAEA